MTMRSPVPRMQIQNTAGSVLVLSVIFRKPPEILELGSTNKEKR